MNSPNKRPLSARRLPTFFKGLCSTAAVSTTFLAGHSAFAQVTATYNNGTAASTFATPTNWDIGVAPGTTGSTSVNNADTAIFPRSILTAAAAVTVDTGRNLANITFNDNSTATTVGAFTLSGGSLLLSAGGTIQTTGTSAVTAASNSAVTSPITLEGGYSIFDNSTGNFANLSIGTNGGGVVFTTAATLGAITLNVGGTNAGTGTGINFYSIISQGTGTTLSLFKTGTASLSLNGANTFSGGVTIAQGVVGIGSNTAGTVGALTSGPFGTGTITLGSASVTTGFAVVQLGSTRTVGNALTVTAGLTTANLINNGGGGAANYSGPITLAASTTATATTLNIGSAATNANALTISGGITGTGNLTINNAATTNGIGGVIISTNPWNNAGTITNSNGGTGALTQTAGGTIGSNVTNFTQNSTTSTTTFSLANSYGITTVNVGTLATSAGGTLGTGNVRVNGGTLTLGSTVSISPTAILRFAGASTINLNDTTTDTVASVIDIDNGAAPLRPGTTYSVTQLNTAFGVTTFVGTGSITIAAVPEPSTWVCGMLVVGGTVGCGLRRRAGAQLS